MTDQERLIFIFETEIRRRRELVRISEVAIGLHEDRIAGHRDIVRTETAEIGRLQREIASVRNPCGHRSQRAEACV